MGLSKAELAEVLHVLINAVEPIDEYMPIGKKAKLNDAIRKAKELEHMLEIQAINESPCQCHGFIRDMTVIGSFHDHDCDLHASQLGLLPLVKGLS